MDITSAPPKSVGATPSLYSPGAEKVRRQGQFFDDCESWNMDEYPCVLAS
jgi:hypothetical protein